MKLCFVHVWSALLPALLLAPVSLARGEVLTIQASRDATLIEHPEGGLANGSGPNFFVGRTSQAANSLRRALLFFDVAGALPGRAIIESVTLILFVTPSNSAPALVRLHRAQTDWGEGGASSSGGGGLPAGPGDVTWLHTYWDSDFWIEPGGDHRDRASAETVVAASGFYSFYAEGHAEHAGLMLQDVRQWLSAPQRNFGWLLTGDESAPQTSKSFASREHSDPSLRPVLEITYREVGVPALR